MDMPTPCPHCGEIVEFDEMVNHPNEFRTMVCDDCSDSIEEENNSGLHLDDHGNSLKWKYEPDFELLEISVNNEEQFSWSCEDDPEDSFGDFVRLWQLAQASVKPAAGGVE